jgi:hypothetical protein
MLTQTIISNFTLIQTFDQNVSFKKYAYFFDENWSKITKNSGHICNIEPRGQSYDREFKHH